MSRILLTLVVAFGVAAPFTASAVQVTALEQKASPARLKAMSAAVADLEKGHLRLKWLPIEIGLIPRPEWYDDYVKLLRKECGIEIVEVDIPTHRESHGYNQVMLLEIEHRFGKDILNKMEAKARGGHAKGQVVAGKQRKPAPTRYWGMRDALADLEKGVLKLKCVPPPAAPWEGAYLKLLKTECGIDIVYVSDREGSDPKVAAQRAGYNAVMLLEIEHRFGQGILDRLGQKAMDDYLKAQKNQ